jgi:hypothetical protein
MAQAPETQLVDPFDTGPHAVPQPPQLLTFVRKSMQVPLHGVSSALQRKPQEPSHVALAFGGTGQAMSQRPQCEGSVARFVQVPLQATVPVAHVVVQAPFEHASPAAQRCPQAPQCSGSLLTSTHSEPHRAYARSHTTLQAPREQVATPWTGAAQAASQAPQCRSSVWVSTQEAPQAVKPASQPKEQLPARQTAAPWSGGAQPASQAPQCAFEVPSSTQAPWQFVVPSAHASAQLPAEHTFPTAQRTPHAPQFSGSLERSMHAPSQASNPESQ